MRLSILLIPITCALILIAIILRITTTQSASQHIVNEEGTINITFCPQEDCEHALLDALNTSKTINCAFYDLTLQETQQLLKEKNARILLFDENLKHANIPVTPVTSAGLMHDKICVLDNRIVVTGSMNPTINDATKNNNNLLIIKSYTLAHAYASLIDDLAANNRRTHGATVNLSGTLIETHFCPQERCEAFIDERITNAQTSVQFMIFTFTADPVGNALIAAHERGVSIEGVIEKRQMSEYSEHIRLREHNISVRADGNSATMHHKVFIIDNRTVITGSYNPTKAASERNDENILIIDDTRIAQAFLREYSLVWNDAT